MQLAGFVKRHRIVLVQPWYNSSQNVFVKAVYEAAAALAAA